MIHSENGVIAKGRQHGASMVDLLAAVDPMGSKLQPTSDD